MVVGLCAVMVSLVSLLCKHTPTSKMPWPRPWPMRGPQPAHGSGLPRAYIYRYTASAITVAFFEPEENVMCSIFTMLLLFGERKVTTLGAISFDSRPEPLVLHISRQRRGWWKLEWCAVFGVALWSGGLAQLSALVATARGTATLRCLPAPGLALARPDCCSRCAWGRCGVWALACSV